MASGPIDFRQKPSLFSDHRSPRVIAEMNDYQFKLVKLQGEFVWHDHKDTDEVFIAPEGEMEIGFRDRAVIVRAGEMFVVPRGVEHITRAARVMPRAHRRTSRGGKHRQCRGALTAQNDVWA